jgi:chemotaxis protein MotB
MGKKVEAPKAQVPEWVLTFGDLMSLLLCFFILLAAFSELKKPREYQEVLDAIKEAFGADGGMGLAVIKDSTSNSMVSYMNERAKRDDNQRNTNEKIDPSVVGRQEKAAVIQEGARHAIGGSVNFEPGSYELSKRDMDMLRTQVTPKISGLTYICPIVGHAWGIEDKRSGLSHDELAFRRAVAVKDYLVRECGVSPAILRAESAADSEPSALGNAPGKDDSGNRRVQVYQTGRTVDQVHPDPNFTGAGN